jgi:hypothetical protein
MTQDLFGVQHAPIEIIVSILVDLLEFDCVSQIAKTAFDLKRAALLIRTVADNFAVGLILNVQISELHLILHLTLREKCVPARMRLYVFQNEIAVSLLPILQISRLLGPPSLHSSIVVLYTSLEVKRAAVILLRERYG